MLVRAEFISNEKGTERYRKPQKATESVKMQYFVVQTHKIMNLV